MKKALKRSFSLLLAITITFGSMYVGLSEVDFGGLFVVKAKAASVSDLTFKLNSDGESYSVTDCNSSASGSLAIPAIYNEKQVTSIGDDAFYLCESLTSITIPDSVTNIGDSAFRVCTNLTSITIPNSVTSIGEYAFNFCDSLTSVTIPDSVTRIGYSAFYNTAYYNDNSNWENGVLYIDNHLIEADTSITGEYEIKSGTKTIADYAFLDCTSLTSITIPDGVISIGNYAFSDCYGLTSITISDGVISIGNSAFSGCDGLTSITIPDGVTSIGKNAFSCCTSLASVTIGDSVTSIGNSAFSGCDGLTSITIPDSVTNIGDSAFRVCTNLTSITIPNSVTSIGEYAFYGCSGLTSITIPDSVTSIGRVAFYKTAYYNNNSNWENGVLYINKHLIDADTSITGAYEIKSGTKTIADDAFYYCESLTSITIPDSVTSIGDYAFYLCESLVSIVIGDGITSMGEYAFNGCRGLTSITIPDGVTSIGDYVFYNCKSLTSITIPDSVTSIGEYAFEYCKSLTSITIPDSVTSIGDWAFNYCESLTSITIPDNVTSIGNHAFYGCSGLTSITIPDSVTNIGDNAFESCVALTKINWNAKAITDFTSSSSVFLNAGTFGSGIELVFGDTVEKIPAYLCYVSDSSYKPNIVSVTIGGNVTSIGGYAFYSCSGLTSITIPDSVTSIGDYAFDLCESLVSIVIGDGITSIGDYAFDGCRGLTSITIPDSVTSIGEYAFSGCTSLASITIPDSVTSIGDYAFYSCSGLTSITIPDNVTSIGKSVFSGCKGLEKVYWNAKAVNDFTSSSNVFYNAGTAGEGIELVFGDSVETIPAYLCYVGSSSYSPKITKVTIGKNVTSIGNHAFYGCSGLTSITIPDSVTSIGKSVFSGCKGLEKVYWNAKAVTDFTSSSSVFYNAGTSGSGIELVFGDTVEKIPAHLCYVSGSSYRPNIVSVTIGGNVTIIGNSAFDGCAGLTSIIIPDSVTSIGNYAFRGCTGLTSLAIGKGVTSIGNHAFYGCSGLTSITIPDNVISIGKSVFSGCKGLEKVYWNAKAVNDFTSSSNVFYNAGTAGEGIELVFGDSVETIPAYLCYVGSSSYSPKITKVTIGKNVISIGNSAFSGCTSLASITIPDNVTSIGVQAFLGFTGTIYCISGSVAHEYAVTNNIKYVLMHIMETENTKIDYENFVICTNVQNATDITAFLGVSETAVAVATASYVYGNLELLGTGSIITVFDGDEYIGDFTLVVEGDTNGDSVCDALDAMHVGLASNGHRTLDGAYAIAADSNADDIVDINDYQSIVNKALA